jgi:hypothetical protein
MSYHRSVRVFNQFTFFSVLIPGLFAVAFALPIAPRVVFGLDAGWVLVLVVGLSFGVGMTLHIASESLESRLEFVYRPTERIATKLNDFAVGEGPAEQIELMEAFVTQYDHRFDTDIEATVADTSTASVSESADTAPPFTRRDGERVFQATLAELWSKNVGPIRILVTTYFLCRSMTLLVATLFLSYLAFGGLLFGDLLRFTPLYSRFLPHDIFAVVLLVVLTTGLVVFYYGYNRYAEYTVNYLIAGFVQLERPGAGGSTAMD